MDLFLYNTESRKKEKLIPQDGKCIQLYTCGPTIYNYAHIGNFRTYTFEDLLRRTIKYFGFNVHQVMNLTDVDDKTIKGANEKGVPLNEFTEPFKQAFFDDKKVLNIESAEKYPAATEYIPQMVEMIEKLIKKGVAYQASDKSVYFAIKKFPRYGCLSHLNLDELKSGASERVQSDEYEKDHVSDFVLWKAYDEKRDGPIFWESPFGKGRPGWHLECSCMAIEILGETIDLHVGGVDNIFPHHENEIAQSESCTEKTFAKHWTHSEHLIVDGKKMSKKLGNFYTIRDLLDKRYTGREIRYMLMHTHYRSQLNFTLEELDATRHTLTRLDDFVIRMQGIENDLPSDEASQAIKTAKENFDSSLADDLNISSALASLFELIRTIHSLADQQKLGKEGAQAVLAFLQKINTVLGVIEFKHEETAPQNIQDLFEKRLQARQEKNWTLSDEIRDQVQSLGWVIEDSPQGSRLKKIK